MLKRNELDNPDSCLNKAADDEPIFVLRAQDLLAVKTVRYWCQLLISEIHKQDPKIDEALALIDAMEAWPTKKVPD